MEDLLDYFNTYRVPAQHLVAFLLAGAAWRWGGAPERWLNLAFVATMVLPIYILWWMFPVRTADEFYLASYLLLDGIAAVLFIAIALQANRNYPLWVAGFQLVAVGTHMVKLMGLDVSPLALTVLITGPSYCQLLLLIAGFVRHVRRERIFGQYRAWRIAPPTPYGPPV
jgi:hypothetical protein